MPDDKDRWQRVQEIFDAVVDAVPADREKQLDVACGGDVELRQLVQSLVEADRLSGDFIGAAIADAALEQPAGTRVGEVVGAFRVIGELGQGGMGTVYLAERADDAYQAQVAIKFLRPTIAAPELERRFLAERQILAGLAHPNIARLLDGGTGPDGSPYLVMEYVDGLALDVWCDQQNADTYERVRLMRRVCDAVQHAHRSLVVHRDIKPSNILVTADGTPKLLDFGIAKLIDVDRNAAAEQTLYHAMTPTYASPEQLQGRPVSTASDTYSLGVVLYRVLAGVPPFDLAGLSPAEVERCITGDPPPPPSARAPRHLAKALRGDLDTIVLKALRADATERYLSAADLSEDLRRWLDREPITARRVTSVYRLRTFARRHPIGVVASTLAVVALAALGALSVVQARRATHQRDLATGRQRVAEQATEFLVELFQLADPNTNNGATITARQMLDRGADRVLKGTTIEPDVRATVAISLATIYRNLAEYDTSEPLIDTALAVRERTSGRRSLEYAAAMHERAELRYNQGAFDSAAAIHRAVLAIQEESAPGDHDATEASLYGLGVSLDEVSQFDEAERVLRRALEMNQRLRGDTGLSVSQNLVALAGVLRRQAKYDEAIPMLETSLRLATNAVGRKNLDVAQSLNHLARTLSLAKRSAEAVPFAREAIQIERDILGVAHPETAASLGNLAGILGDLGRYDEAEDARRESLAMLRTVYGTEHPYIAATINSLGDLMMRKRDFAAAERYYRESLAMHRRTLSKTNPNLAAPLTGLGRALLALGRPADAEPSLREAYQLRLTGLPQGHWQTATTGIALGECLVKRGRSEEALPYLRDGMAAMRATFGPADDRTITARQELVVALRAMGRGTEADSLSADR